MKLKTVFAAILVILLASCQSAIDDEINLKKGSAPANTKLTEAIKKAEQMMSATDGRNTRSSCRQVETITPLASETRATEDMHSWYVVNYSDNQGFCIVTDEDVEDPVAAFSPNGYFDLSQINKNTPVAIFVDAINRFGTEAFDSDSNENPEETQFTRGIGDLEPYPGTPDTGKTVFISYPLLEDEVQKWHQSYPFNRHCHRLWDEKTQNYENGVAGCTAIACGMIMTYYEWPPKYGDHRFDWGYMQTTPVNEPFNELHGFASLLIYDLGLSQNLNVTYGLNSSSASIDNFPRTFMNFGYSKPLWENFNETSLRTFLSYHHPIIITGDGYDYVDNTDVHHAWVIDGMYIQYLGDFAADPHYQNSYNYYHNVWGWNGLCNGYYRMPSKIIVDTTKNGTRYYFSYYSNLKIMSNFSPIK